jgi:hypothetical protein
MHRSVATIFVWAVWIASVLAGFYLVWECGSPIPLWDDYLVIPQLTGATPITPEWLWEVHYSHRIPLGKLAFVALAKLSSYDFRGAMYFNVFLLAALSAILIRTAQAVRGWLTFADAFFPVLLLSYSNHRDMLWFWQVSVVIPVFLQGVVLSRIIRAGWHLSMREVVGIGLCLLLLPLCGTLGLIYVPFVAFWLAYASWRQWRDPDSGRKQASLVGLGLAAAALVLVGLYYFHYADPTAGPRSWQDWHTVRRALKGSLQFLSKGLGDLPPTFFPISGFAMAALLGASALAFLFQWWKRPDDRLRCSGLFMFLAALGALVFGVGWGRSGPSWGDTECLHCRYVTMMAPTLIWIYLIWLLFPIRAVGQWIQTGLLAVMCFLLPYCIQTSWADESWVHDWATTLQKEMDQGVPASMLTERFYDYVYWLDEYAFTKNKMTHGLQLLRDAGSKACRNLRDDPEYQEIDLPLRDAQAIGMTWRSATRTGQSKGGESYFRFDLRKPVHVYAVQPVITYEAAEIDALTCTATWGRKGAEQENRAALCNLMEPNDPQRPKEKTPALWIDDTIQQFRFYPADLAVSFHLSGVKLRVKPEKPNQQAQR